MTSRTEKANMLFDLQADIGKALWQIQAFEDTLAHLIAIVLEMPANASLGEAEAILENVRRNTLGRLLNRVRGSIHFDESFEPFVKRFVSERNWLVHRSWRMYRGVLHKENEYKMLRLRVRGLAADALEFNELFSRFIEDWAKEKGVTSAELEELQQEFLDVWRTEI